MLTDARRSVAGGDMHSPIDIARLLAQSID
jgi:hypothetical protein